MTFLLDLKHALPSLARAKGVALTVALTPARAARVDVVQALRGD